MVDPRVALLFMIPGYSVTLQIYGQARLSLDVELLREFDVNGNCPLTAIVVKIERIYFQCARALKSSQLWNSARHADPDLLYSAGTLIRSAIDDFDSVAYDAQLQERQERTLY